MKKRENKKKTANKRTTRTQRRASSATRKATQNTPSTNNTTVQQTPPTTENQYVTVEIRTHKDAQGGHPHIIVDSVDDNHVSVGLTHDKYKGKGHTNITLTVNPLGKPDITYMHRQGTVYSKKSYKEQPQKGIMTKNDNEKAKNIGARAKQKYLNKKSEEVDQRK